MKEKRLWDVSKTLAENARVVLPRLARDFFRTGEKALAEGSSPRELHRFRFAAKEFRYTLEIFRPLYGRELERRLAILQRVQRFLGDLNDSTVTLGFLPDQGMEETASRLASRMAALRSDFQRYWRETAGRPDAASAWVNYLARYARDPQDRHARRAAAR